MSLKIAGQFADVFKGDTLSEQASRILQSELQSIIEQGKDA